MTVKFALPNLIGKGKDGMIHHCHLPYTINKETEPREMNDDWSTGINTEVMFVILLGFFWKNLLRTRNIAMLILPRRFRCQGRMSVHTGMG